MVHHEWVAQWHQGESSKAGLQAEPVHLYLLAPVVRAQVQSECKQGEPAFACLHKDKDGYFIITAV
jgi:hypothetical protein